MTTPLHLKYFICINDQFPSSVSEWSDTLPQRGHIYSVRRRYADDYPTDINAEEAYLLWEIRSSCPGGKKQTYFSARHFQEVQVSEIGSILSLDQSAIDEIGTRFIFRVDKLRRMGSGIASELCGYKNGILEFDVSTQHGGYFDGDKVHAAFRNIPSSWKTNPELKAATGYRMKVFLSKRNDSGGWEANLVNEIEGDLPPSIGQNLMRVLPG